MKNAWRSLLLPILVLGIPSLLDSAGGAPAGSGRGKQTGATVGSGTRSVRAKPVVGRSPAAAERPSPQGAYGKLPLQFEENRGQSDARVKYLARGRGYLFFVTPQETVLALRQGRREDGRVGPPRLGAWLEPEKLSPSPVEQMQTVLRFELEGANAKPKVEAVDRLPGISNYFIGNDPAKWRTKIPNYAKVVMRNVYPGIDAAYYGKEGRVESDFIVAPGRDPAAIRMRIAGAQHIEVNSRGDLVLATSGGDVKLAKPVLYQTIKGARKEVEGGYRLLGENEAGFEAGSYDHRVPLVIDPTLDYSTYLGGDGADGDHANAIAVDSTGAAYVTGFTTSLTDFPTTAGAHQGALGGPFAQNAFVTKFSADGASLMYSTYLGGSGTDTGFGIAVDGAGKAYLTGSTTSTDFPTAGPPSTLVGFQAAFVAKLSASGAALLFSFYLSGESFDQGNAIAVDANGNAYVTGDTTSMMFPVFPSPTAVFQGTLAGSRNAFVAKFDPTGAKIWVTYLGGNSIDLGLGIAVDGSNPANVYVTGQTDSTTFPTVSPIQPNLGGPFATNAFVSEFLGTKPLGTMLVYSTYLGGSDFDAGNGIAVDAGGSAIVAGSSFSRDFPLVASIQAHDDFEGDAFVTKIAPGGGSFVFSTVFGDQSGRTEALAVTLDPSGNIYVGGDTTAHLLPTRDPLETAVMLGSACECGAGHSEQAGFVMELNPGGSDYLFSTFLGGSVNVLPLSFVTFGRIREAVNGIAADPMGNVYVAGIAQSTDFPTDAFQPTLKSNNSNGFVAKISPTTLPGPQVYPAAVDLGTPGMGNLSQYSFVTLANGTNPLLNISITLTGPNAADFTESDSCGPELLPHVVCAIALRARPSTPGTETVTLTISDSDPSSPQLVTVTVSGGSVTTRIGTLTVTPGSLAFGNQEITTSSATQPLTFTAGAVPAVPVTASIFLTGGIAGDYFLNPGTCNATRTFNLTVTVPAGASCAIQVGFRPVAVGSSGNSMLQVTGNFTTVNGNMTVNVGLSGTGTQMVVLNPTSIQFSSSCGAPCGQPPPQIVGTPPPAQTVTLTNTSSTMLTNIAVSLSQFPSGAGFAFGPGAVNSCVFPGGSLGSGLSCTISVSFNPPPNMPGSASATLIVTDSDPASQTVSLSGYALNPQGTLAPVSPASVSFGAIAIGTSGFNGIGLQNIGNATLAISLALATGDFTETDNCASIPLNGSCFINFTFTPSAVGIRTTTLTIMPGALGTMQTVVTLTGSGIGSTTAAVAPATVTFPNTTISVASAPLFATFSNTGTRPLVLLQNPAGATGAAGALGGANPGDFSFTFLNGNSNPATLGCGDFRAGLAGARYNPQIACPIMFTFTPTATGMRTATFTIADNSSNFPLMHTVVLQGNAFTGPAITVTPNPLNVGNQIVGQASLPMPVTLMNPASGTLTITSLTPSGPNAGDFAQSLGTCGASLPINLTGGQSCMLQYVFTPTVMPPAAETAAITITDNLTPSTVILNLMGTGIAPMVTLSGNSLAFGTVNVGTTSTAMPVTLMNSGTAPLTISSIGIIGPNAADFAQTNTCPISTPAAPKTLAVGVSCTITATFAPSLGANESATIQIMDNAAGNPQTVALSGMGMASTLAGFTFTVSTPPNGGNGSTVSVLPGDTAVFTLILQPNPGFIGPITVACLSGIPATIATASPTMINVTTTPSPPITITCTLRTNCVAQLVGPRAPGGWPQSPAPVPPFTAASGVALLLALWWRKAARTPGGPSERRAWAVGLAPVWATFLLLLLVITWTACVSNPPPAIPNAPTTPAGVYQIQVVATAPGGVKQVVSLNVHVI